jgi:hypothetical protein
MTKNNYFKEKSYLVDEENKLLNVNKRDQKCLFEAEILYKGIAKCLQDYQGEIKHSKLIMKEV